MSNVFQPDDAFNFKVLKIQFDVSVNAHTDVSHNPEVFNDSVNILSESCIFNYKHRLLNRDCRVVEMRIK